MAILVKNPNPKVKSIQVWMTTDKRLFKGLPCANKHQARLDAKDEIAKLSSLDLSKFTTRPKE